MKHCCDDMVDHLARGEIGLVCFPKWRTYGLKYRDGISYQKLVYCPWCGGRLPRPLREEWAAAVEEAGFDVTDPNLPDYLPEKYKTEEWFEERGLDDKG